MKSRLKKISGVLVVLLIAVTGFAAPWMQVNGVSGDYASFHYYIDESEGQQDSITIEFWPNEGNVQTVELWSNLNRRDLATLNPADPNTVVAGDTNHYFGAYTMQNAGGGKYTLTLPIRKCGAYRINCRYKLNGSSTWKWAGVRDAAVVISDVATRDMIIYEVQVNVVDATGDGYANRSTFADLNDTTRFSLDYVKSLGVNTLWLMPFHPIGSKVDGNYGDPGSPYSIKNMWKVGEHLGKNGSRDGAMQEFKAFMAAAESKGVNILFDTIFNHTAKDAEIERDPEFPVALAANPMDQIRNIRPRWYSKYTGNGYCNWTQDPGGSPPYEYWATADNANQVGPAPADRHDFGKWCDTIDLFWGTYSALGNPQSDADGMWGASYDVKKMTEYFAYFTQYWLEQTSYAIDGFRCDFAQGLPPQAWEYMINKAKSLKPELAFMAESLDGGNVSKRAARHFDIVNESWVWGVAEKGGTTTGMRAAIDERKAAYGYAGVLRGLINHDQNAPDDKWWTLSRYAVGSAIDGAPQMFMGQELGYRNNWGFSKFRYEFSRYVPDIRNYGNMMTLWNDTAWDHDALWNRYKEINLGRQRAKVLRTAEQYYLNKTDGFTHDQIFAVMKYSNLGWDAADQDVVLCFINLQPGVANAGMFKVNVPAVYLSPTKKYNVRNLASSKPDQYLWATAKTGSEIASQGLYIGFPASLSSEGAVAQFLKLEAVMADAGLTWVGNIAVYPPAGQLDPTDDLWIDAQTFPISQGQVVTLFYRTSTTGVFQQVAVDWNYNGQANAYWHKNLGKFAAGTTVEYYISAVQGTKTLYDNNNGANYKITCNNTVTPVQWVGNTYTWPPSGQITSNTTLWINTESWPKGAGVSSVVVYSTNNVNWLAAPMPGNGTVGNNDAWHADLGRFPKGTTVRFAVTVIDGAGVYKWDSRNGQNYTATVQ